jgi:hypothetical protein
MQVTSLHPKFYKCIFFWNVKSTSNYSEKLKLAGIHTVTLWVLLPCFKFAFKGTTSVFRHWKHSKLPGFVSVPAQCFMYYGRNNVR